MKKSMVLKRFFILFTYLMFLLSLNRVGEIQAADNPVIFLGSDKKLAQMGEEVVFTVKAIKEGEPAAKLTYSASGLPDGAVFDANTQTFFWKPMYNSDKRTHELKFTASDGINTAGKTIYLFILAFAEKTVLAGNEQDYWDKIRAARGYTLAVSARDLPALSDKTFLYQPVADGDYVVTEDKNALYLNNLATSQKFQITDSLSGPANAAIIDSNIVYDDNKDNIRKTYQVSFTVSPLIESVSLTGPRVTIKGSHFGNTQGTSKILYSDTEVANPNWSDKEISFVPTGITAGENIGIKVVAEGGENKYMGADKKSLKEELEKVEKEISAVYAEYIAQNTKLKLAQEIIDAYKIAIKNAQNDEKAERSAVMQEAQHITYLQMEILRLKDILAKLPPWDPSRKLKEQEIKNLVGALNKAVLEWNTKYKGKDLSAVLDDIKTKYAALIKKFHQKIAEEMKIIGKIKAKKEEAWQKLKELYDRCVKLRQILGLPPPPPLVP
jgi:hypothetical protein